MRETKRLYCALFWIQGKTLTPSLMSLVSLYCALFWIQGKTAIFWQPYGLVLYCALFWIQGKTADKALSIPLNCTVPYFGFKAKRIMEF